MVKAKVDLLAIDGAHGHSTRVLDAIRQVKAVPEVDLIAGNVATFEGACEMARLELTLSKSASVPARSAPLASSPAGVPQITAIAESRVPCAMPTFLSSPTAASVLGRHHQGHRGRSRLRPD
jgi:IMP dehydrogenase